MTKEEALQPKQEDIFCWQSPNGTIYQCSDDDVLHGSVPMYLCSKPSKPWVGLTDEDLFDIANVNFGEPDLQLFIEMGRLVQEELKEKNA